MHSVLPTLLLACSLEPPVAGAVQVTTGQGSEQNPCLLPGDDTLVFTRFDHGYNDGPAAILSVPATGGDTTALVDAGDNDHVNLPGRCSSSDGGLLALSSDEQDRDEIWIADLRSGDRTRLTDRPGQRSYEPAFARDDATLVFQSGVFQSGPDGGVAAIYRIGVDGIGEAALTDGLSDAREPNPSPVTDDVVYQSDAGGTWGLWTVSLTGGDPVVLLDTPAEETDASFSSDGSLVVFATDDCAGLSCIATWDGDSVDIIAEADDWYLGAPALAADGTLFAEGCPGDPDEGEDTVIWRFPAGG